MSEKIFDKLLASCAPGDSVVCVLFLVVAAFVLVVRLVLLRCNHDTHTFVTNAQSRARFVTSLTLPVLAVAVDVVFELDAHLSLHGLLADERVSQQLVGAGAVRVILQVARFDESREALRPDARNSDMRRVSLRESMRASV